ncbi:ATP synthase F1 subunit delta [Desulfonatronovibrio magnus]|uniref:ATP synthase F1 subunit delta n=1 Tax=Desulfonatronovibrio magnus TaxID=698827 RepID=UPI0005EBC828|nr:ATP synthase F1 subunit delta [Desulfonatronovibrio magnus]RQD55516.1 MAG: F0F1 ATP synthase subunit delta [Desulfonatronovibrio sp. MSAO_Bac4]
MIGNIVARRYARALFALGQKQGDKELKAYGEDMTKIVSALEGAPELLRIFKNPIFNADEKKGILKQLLAKLKPGQVVGNFCYLLADKGRLDCLPEIQVYYSKLLDESQGIVRGEIVTAIKLADNMKQEIVGKLEKQSGRKVVLDYEVEPEILGGIKLKVGDKVLDASIRAQLQILKENIKRGE